MTGLELDFWMPRHIASGVFSSEECGKILSGEVSNEIEEHQSQTDYLVDSDVFLPKPSRAFFAQRDLKIISIVFIHSERGGITMKTEVGIRYAVIVTIIAVILALGLPSQGPATAAAPVFVEDFETDGLGTRYTATEMCSDGSGDFFTRTDGLNIGAFVEYFLPSNSYWWAAMDTDGTPECTLPTQTITWTNIDISDYSDLVFSGLFAEDDDGTNEDWDDNDFTLVEVSIDGGGWQKVLAFENDGSQYNSEPLQDTDFDGIGDGPALTPTFSEFSAVLPGTGSTLDLRITTHLDAGDEDVAFDLLKIDGVALVAFEEDFETDGLDTRYTASEVCNDGLFDFFTRTDGTDISPDIVYDSPSNQYYWAAMDTDGPPTCSYEIQTITWSGIDISGYTSLWFKGLFAEDLSDHVYGDWDEDDYTFVEVDIDSTGWQKILAFENDGRANNGAALQDTDFDGTGDGPALTPTFTEFKAFLPDMGSNLDLRITTRLESHEEDIAFDLLSIQVPPKTDLAISKVDSADLVPINTTFFYTVTVDNISDANAENVVMTDTLPAGVTFNSAVPDQGSCAETAGAVRCELHTITKGESVEVVISVVAPAITGPIINDAEVATTREESSTSNNTTSEITIISTGLDYVTIHDIQYTEDPSGNSPYQGLDGITTEGIVTRVYDNGYFIEEPTAGPWSGLWVYDSNTPLRGDRVRITGTVSEYYGLTEMGDLTSFTIESSGNPVPGPDILATGSVSQEQWESVLVRVENITVTADDLGFGEWSINDGSGDVIVDDKGIYTYVPVNGQSLLAVIGPLDYSFSAFKMLPKDNDDIILDYVPIYDIQYTTDPSGNSPYMGQVGITTEGVVMGLFYNGYFIEDPAAGPWNGLWVYDTSNLPVRGDRVRITGTVSEYNNNTEMEAITAFIVESSGNPVPGPEVLTTGAVSQEQWEGVLVRVENITVTNDSLGYGEWAINDGSGDVVVDDKGSYTYVPVFGDPLIAVIGPLDYSFDVFKIQPRDDDDIIQAGLDYTPIYDIQYTTDPSGDSPYKDQSGVTTEGIVTGVFDSGYFIEDPSAGPWSGLWVYDSNTPLRGDRVRITGTVSEYYGLTEMGDLTAFIVESSGNTVPGPDILSTGLVSQEQWESVLVRVENITVTNDSLGYGEWSIDDGSGDVVVDDKGSYTYVPVFGDQLIAVIGPLDYSFDVFKMLPRDDDDIIQQQLVINEIHADPADDISGDANGDGTRDASEDEFVEIANALSDDLDISGWTLSDGVGVRHTFPAGSIIPANCSIVIFGGGTPTGSFGDAVVQVASTGLLGLNNGGDTVTLHDGTNPQAVVEYGAEGGNNQSLTRDPDISGDFVEHSTASGAAGALFSPGTRVDGSKFPGCNLGVFGICGDPATTIHDVQGDGEVSPLLGMANVTIEGVVVGDFQGTDELHGFYLQEEDTDADGNLETSEGIFVYQASPTLDVNVGDVVRLQGDVNEYYNVTQIEDLANITVCTDIVGAIASPSVIDLPMADVTDFEHYEGMLVIFTDTLTASQNYFQGRYGQVTLSVDGRLYQPTQIHLPDSTEMWDLVDENQRRMIVLDDGTTQQNPDPIPYIGDDNTLRAGDIVDGLTGLMDYGPISSDTSIRHYRLQPSGPVSFTRVNARENAPEAGMEVLRVASFNVLNLFNGDGLGGGFPTSRGANTPEEYQRQIDKIITATYQIDADVLGLMEIENDAPPNSAIEDLVAGLNAVAGAGTYDFIDTGVVGTDEIRVALIYQPGRVTPLGSYAILDSSVDPNFRSDYNRPAVAQTFQDDTNGEVFTVVVNHLKSKGSACDAIGDPDLGDGQGNCNQTRTDAAIALANWMASYPTGYEDDDVLIIGDLNAYAMEDPVRALEDAGYIDMLDTHTGPYAYSYIFDGNAGVLDHALASASMADQVVNTQAWHINTDEPSVIDYNLEYKPEDLYEVSPYRSSDHDPILIDMLLSGEKVVIYFPLVLR
jgi:uncharacterized repeat protein (TIGR01451 family)